MNQPKIIQAFLLVMLAIIPVFYFNFSYTEPCSATVFKTISAYENDYLGCFEDSAKRGIPVDQNCILRAKSRLEARAQSWSCIPAQGISLFKDQLAFRSKDVIAALVDQPVSTCRSKKIGAVSNFLKDEFKDLAKNATRPDEVRLSASRQKNLEKLRDAFVKAEQRPDCAKNDFQLISVNARNLISTILMISSNNRPSFDAVSVGNDFLCILVNGGVKCLGSNQSGALGNGTNLNSQQLVQVTDLQSGVVKIVTGRGRACALLDDGIVKCWGAGFGAIPTIVSSNEGVKDLAAGGENVCILNSADQVRCLGGSAQEDQILQFLSGVTSLDVIGEDQIVCGTNENKVYCVTVSGQNQKVVDFSDTAIQVKASRHYACALLQNGKTECFYRYAGSTNGFLTSLSATSAPGLNNLPGPASDFAVGGGVFCSLVSGQVHCKGMNNVGQKGDGADDLGYYDQVFKLFPLNVTSVSLAEEPSWVSCAITHSDKKSLYCWGKNLGAVASDPVRCKDTAGAFPITPCNRFPTKISDL